MLTFLVFIFKTGVRLRYHAFLKAAPAIIQYSDRIASLLLCSNRSSVKPPISATGCASYSVSGFKKTIKLCG